MGLTQDYFTDIETSPLIGEVAEIHTQLVLTLWAFFILWHWVSVFLNLSKLSCRYGSDRNTNVLVFVGKLT